MQRFTKRDEEFLRAIVKSHGRIWYRGLGYAARERLHRLIDMRLAAVEEDGTIVAVQPAAPHGTGLRLIR